MSNEPPDDDNRILVGSSDSECAGLACAQTPKALEDALLTP